MPVSSLALSPGPGSPPAASSPAESPGTRSTSPSARPLSEEEQKQVEELRERDAEVRRHEAAHKAAAGQYARGGPKFEYQTGPDGRAYAVGGEVAIDTTPIAGDPRATIRKADVIRRAALAPEEPSAKDRSVAAEAERMKAKAMKELAEETGGDPLDVRAAAAGAPAAAAPMESRGRETSEGSGVSVDGNPDRRGLGRYAAAAAASPQADRPVPGIRLDRSA